MQQVLFKNQLFTETPFRKVRLLIPNRRGHIALDPREVCYCRKENPYMTKWFLGGGQELVVKYSFAKSFEVLQGYDFFRLDASILINLNKIFQISNKSAAKIYLTSGVEFPISRRKRVEFLNLLKERC